MRKLKIDEVEDEEKGHGQKREKSREYAKRDELAVAQLGLDEGQGEDEKQSQAAIGSQAQNKKAALKKKPLKFL